MSMSFWFWEAQKWGYNSRCGLLSTVGDVPWPGGNTLPDAAWDASGPALPQGHVAGSHSAGYQVPLDPLLQSCFPAGWPQHVLVQGYSSHVWSPVFSFELHGILFAHFTCLFCFWLAAQPLPINPVAREIWCTDYWVYTVAFCFKIFSGDVYTAVAINI